MRLRHALLPTLVLCGLPGTVRPAAAQPVYIALGDSVAYGYTNSLNVSNGDQGYVAPFADFLGNAFFGGVRPKVDNLAISGETTQTFTGGSSPAASANLNYAGNPTQSQESKFFQTVTSEQGQGNAIDYVTFSLGADDAFALAGTPRFLTEATATQQAQINALVQNVQSSEDAFLGQFRAQLPQTQLLLLSYYNPFPVFTSPVTGDELLSDQLSSLAAYANADYAAAQQGLAAKYGGRFVDISGLPASDTYNADPDSNPLFPTGVHPTAAGYQYIAGRLSQAAVPEPGAWALLALGLPLVGLTTRRRRA